MHDPECETLAAHFLQSEVVHLSVERHVTYAQAVESLAETIQAAVEGWFQDHETRDEGLTREQIDAVLAPGRGRAPGREG
jgi:hypothetical protein